MSRRGRVTFVAGCLLVFGLLAALITCGPPSTGPSDKAPATVTLVPGATRPAGLAVTDLHDVGQLRARCGSGFLPVRIRTVWTKWQTMC